MERSLAQDCSECDMHYVDDKGIDRCKEFDNAILDSTTEKHCLDSIY